MVYQKVNAMNAHYREKSLSKPREDQASSIILMFTERHVIDEIAQSKLYHLSGRPIPSSIGLVPNSDGSNEGTR